VQMIDDQRREAWKALVGFRVLHGEGDVFGAVRTWVRDFGYGVSVRNLNQ